MQIIESIKQKVIEGQAISKEEACFLYDADLKTLTKAANEIREYFCGNRFDLCTIVNGKSGRCSEDCKYCAQSACYSTAVHEYPLLSGEELLSQAKYNEERGVMRYSIVTSGKRLSSGEVEQLCEGIRLIKAETGMKICVSLGLLKEEDFRKIKEAGAERVHNNLETSERYFPEVCTTHTYQEKKQAIIDAKKAGLEVCSGGIMGLGEAGEDRIDMAFTLREMGVCSVPINVLNPIPGTPYEKNTLITNEELIRIVAVYRFILPDVTIRLAGGRGLLPDMGEACMKSGVNGVITGDMLTTTGNTIESDMKMIQKLGYEVRSEDE